MTKNQILSTRSQAGTALRASKWLTAHVLLDVQEMAQLIAEMEPFWIFPLGGVIKKEQEEISKAEFLNAYGIYIEALKSGVKPEESLFKRVFTSAWTVALDHLYAVPVSEESELIKLDKPVVQLQHHTCDYSADDGKFRSMVFGEGSLTWGIQFAYPQLFQDKDHETHQVDESPAFRNTAFFKRIQRWIRHNTAPTPFLVDGKQLNVPIRLGKSCFAWINRHPQLAQKGLRVLQRKDAV